MQPKGNNARLSRRELGQSLEASAATNAVGDVRKRDLTAPRTMQRGFQWDIARQIERLSVLKRLLPRYAEWGYHELYLHLEDAIHYPSLPGIGRDDAYSYTQLGELVRAATRAGIGVVPIINLLGHTQYLIKHPGLRDLNELRDEHGAPLEHGQICPLHPRTLEVAEKLLRDVKPFCTTGKVHVGLDESFHLGKCPRCRAEVEKIGLAAHFAGHVRRLHALCTKLDLELGMWADMLYFVPEAIPLLPRGITAYEWYYYPFAKLPRVELFNFAERDLATPLKKQGIRYYGCPMNGAFRHEPMPIFGDRFANIKSWWRRCHEVQADGFLITSWEAYRLAFETTTVVDAGAANLWLAPDKPDDNVSLLAVGLQRALGAENARAIARSLLQADEYAFAGYARWQINDRWDVFAGTANLRSFERERAFFRRQLLRAECQNWPKALHASIKFRTYLAERDVFVRQAAHTLFRLRRSTGIRHGLERLLSQCEAFSRALKEGVEAATEMWRLTRDPKCVGPNQKTLESDKTKLAECRSWLRRTRTRPELVYKATPFCGAWQLQFTTHNFAPAAQKIVVEQRAPDGSWRELLARHTIEFRAQAARPTSKLKREFIAPIDSPDAILRIVLDGVGQVKISHIQVTNGTVTKRSVGFGRPQTIGSHAPANGLPSGNIRREAKGIIVKQKRDGLSTIP